MVFGDLLDAGALGPHDGAVEPLRDDALDGHLGILGETGQRAGQNLLERLKAFKF